MTPRVRDTHDGGASSRRLRSRVPGCDIRYRPCTSPRARPEHDHRPLRQAGSAPTHEEGCVRTARRTRSTHRTQRVRRERAAGPVGTHRRAATEAPLSARARETVGRSPRRDGPAREGAGGQDDAGPHPDGPRHQARDLHRRLHGGLAALHEAVVRRLPSRRRGEGKRVAFVAPYGLYPPAIRATGVTVRGPEGPRRGGRAARSCDRALPACETTCVLDYDDPSEFLGTGAPEALRQVPRDDARPPFDAFAMPRLPLSAYSSPELQQRGAGTSAEQLRRRPARRDLRLQPARHRARADRRDVAVPVLPARHAARHRRGQGSRPALPARRRRGRRDDGAVHRGLATRRARPPRARLPHRQATALAVDEGPRRASASPGTSAIAASSVLASHKGELRERDALDATASWDRPLDAQRSRAR